MMTALFHLSFSSHWWFQDLEVQKLLQLLCHLFSALLLTNLQNCHVRTNIWWRSLVGGLTIGYIAGGSSWCICQVQYCFCRLLSTAIAWAVRVESCGSLEEIRQIKVMVPRLLVWQYQYIFTIPGEVCWASAFAHVCPVENNYPQTLDGTKAMMQVCLAVAGIRGHT